MNAVQVYHLTSLSHLPPSSTSLPHPPLLVAAPVWVHSTTLSPSGQAELSTHSLREIETVHKILLSSHSALTVVSGGLATLHQPLDNSCCEPIPSLPPHPHPGTESTQHTDHTHMWADFQALKETGVDDGGEGEEVCVRGGYEGSEQGPHGRVEGGEEREQQCSLQPRPSHLVRVDGQTERHNPENGGEGGGEGGGGREEEAVTQESSVGSHKVKKTGRSLWLCLREVKVQFVRSRCV